MEANTLYGIREIWNHTVLITARGNKVCIRDGLREILESEGAIPKKDDTWYLEKIAHGRCAKLLIWEGDR
jgi:hypothetical protein